MDGGKLQKIVKKAVLAETNEVLNVKELARYFDVSKNVITTKVYELRRRGQLPKVDKSLQIDAYQRPYTSRELRFIVGAINADQTCSQVAE
ncbi:helix-turn-helix domain-containing protein, partial [Loigolactobacillus coryniformis]|uniref:helix-turn-helix domain-containing protein n=1 Tax=Loigolactobacillus coryniformis TaxID=1610 RepID=UPI0002192DCD